MGHPHLFVGQRWGGGGSGVGEVVADEDVVGGGLLAELAEHAHDLAAMEGGVIDDMEQEFPAGDGPVDGVEFEGEVGFGEGGNVGVQALPYFGPALLQVGQVGLRWSGRVDFWVGEFGERDERTLAELAEPEVLRIVDMAERSGDAGVG